MATTFIHAADYASQKVTTVGADRIAIQDSAAGDAPKGTTVAGLAGIISANVVVTPSGNLASTDVQAALLELQGDVDSLTSASVADNFRAEASDPTVGDGNDGDFHMNVTTGDIFGPKAAGAWPGTPVANAYDQLGLSSVAGAAPTVGGTVGVGTVAARSDHSHPFQSAADTSSTAVGNLTSTDVDSALAELQGDIDTRALTTRSIATTAPLAGGGDLSSDRTLTFDINVLSAPAGGVASGDELVIADVSAANAITKITVADILALAPAASLQATTTVGNTTNLDMEITDSSKGLILSDGVNRHRITINAAGALITTII